jgi:hypothetical protein
MSQREFKWQLCEKTEWEKKDKIGNQLISHPLNFSLFNSKMDTTEDSCELAFNLDLLRFIKTINKQTQEYEIQKHLEILDVFQQMPRLLDPYLSQIIAYLVDPVAQLLQSDQKESSFAEIDYLFRFLQRIVKIRGWKAVVAFFDNSVHLLEPVIISLECVTNCSWETRYILLLWASLLIMTPFDLSRIETNQRLFNRVLLISKQYITSVGAEYHAACLLQMRLLTRYNISNKKKGQLSTSIRLYKRYHTGFTKSISV